MARYIDADVFKEYVNSMSTHPLNGWSALGVLAAIAGMPHGSDVTNPTAQKAERMNTGTIKHGTRTGSGRSMERKAGGPEMTTLLICGCTFFVVAACVLAAGLMNEAGKNSREEEDEH